MLFCFIASAIWGFLALWATEMKVWPVWATCGTGTVLCFLRAYVYFSMNDFEYFQDVKKLNAFIDRHNKKIEENEQKRVKIQQDLANGTLLLPPPDADPPKPAPQPQPRPPRPANIQTNPSAGNLDSIADQPEEQAAEDQEQEKPVRPEPEEQEQNAAEAQTEDQEAARAR